MNLGAEKIEPNVPVDRHYQGSHDPHDPLRKQKINRVNEQVGSCFPAFDKYIQPMCQVKCHESLRASLKFEGLNKNEKKHKQTHV